MPREEPHVDIPSRWRPGRPPHLGVHSRAIVSGSPRVLPRRTLHIIACTICFDRGGAPSPPLVRVWQWHIMCIVWHVACGSTPMHGVRVFGMWCRMCGVWVHAHAFDVDGVQLVGLINTCQGHAAVIESSCVCAWQPLILCMFVCGYPCGMFLSGNCSNNARSSNPQADDGDSIFEIGSGDEDRGEHHRRTFRLAPHWKSWAGEASSNRATCRPSVSSSGCFINWSMFSSFFCISAGGRARARTSGWPIWNPSEPSEFQRLCELRSFGGACAMHALAIVGATRQIVYSRVSREPLKWR